MEKTHTVICGSKQWFLSWEIWHRKMALKFSRLKYPFDDQCIWGHLMWAEYYKAEAEKAD